MLTATTTADAGCCQAHNLCPECQATTDEIRAVRRDAVIHLVASLRPRRTGATVR